MEALEALGCLAFWLAIAWALALPWYEYWRDGKNK